MMHSDAPGDQGGSGRTRRFMAAAGQGGGGSGAERGAYAYTAVTVMVSAFGMLTLPGTGVSFVMLFLRNKSG